MSLFNPSNYNPSYFVSDTSNIDIKDVFKSPGIKSFDLTEALKTIEGQQGSFQSFVESKEQEYTGSVNYPTIDYRSEVEYHKSRVDQAIKLNQAQNNIKPEKFAEFEDRVLKRYVETGGKIEMSIPTVSLTQDQPSIVNPDEFVSDTDNIDEATFRAGSLFGLVLDPNASSPQFNELVLSNMQIAKAFALRMRGGANGEFWQDTVNKSEYLRNMFQEDPETKAYIDKYSQVLTAPAALSLTGMTDFAYTGPTPLDILYNADIPEGPVKWDPKKAIEEIKQNNPQLAFHLFETIGITEENLLNEKVSRNPATFKFFIADTIDSYAYGRFTEAFQKQAGSLNQTWTMTLWPLIRDSLNSNDMVVDAGLTAAGAVATLTFAGLTALSTPLAGDTPLPAAGAAATAASATFTGSRIASLALKAKTIFNTGARLTRLTQTSNRLYKTSLQARIWGNRLYNLAPHNLLESGMRVGASRSAVLKKILYGSKEPQYLFKTLQAAKSTEKGLKGVGLSLKNTFKAVGIGQGTLMLSRYALRSAISGASQGAAEDLIRQGYAMPTGYQEGFDSKRMLSNMVEEATGEIFLGGTFNFFAGAPRASVEIAKQNYAMADAFSKKVTSIKKTSWDRVQNQFNALPAEVQNKLMLLSRLHFGIDTENKKLTPNQQVDLIVKAYELRKQANRLAKDSPNIGTLIDSDTTSKTINEIIDIFGEDSNDKTRLELFGTLEAALTRFQDEKGNSTLTPEQTENLLLNLIETHISSKADASLKITQLKKFVDVWSRNQVNKQLTEQGKNPEEFEKNNKADYDNLILEESKKLQQKTQEAKDLWISTITKDPNKVIDKDDPYMDIRVGLTISDEMEQNLIEAAKEELKETKEGKINVSINGVSTTVSASNEKTAQEIREDEEEKRKEHIRKTGKQPSKTTTAAPKLIASNETFNKQTKTWTNPDRPVINKETQGLQKFNSIGQLRDYLINLNKDNINNVLNKFIQIDVLFNTENGDTQRLSRVLTIEIISETKDNTGITTYNIGLVSGTNQVYGIDSILKFTNLQVVGVGMFDDDSSFLLPEVKDPTNSNINIILNSSPIGYITQEEGKFILDPKEIVDTTPMGKPVEASVPVVEEVAKKDVVSISEEEVDSMPPDSITIPTTPEALEAAPEAPEALEAAPEAPEALEAAPEAPEALEAAPEAPETTATAPSTPIPSGEVSKIPDPSEVNVSKSKLNLALDNVDLDSLEDNDGSERVEEINKDICG